MTTNHPNKRERTTGLLNAAFLALHFFLSGPPVHAQTVSCGSVIGPNAEVSLQADIGPCDDKVTAALTIIGPATVNLTDKVAGL
jgi:hypothetical protein